MESLKKIKEKASDRGFCVVGELDCSTIKLISKPINYYIDDNSNKEIEQSVVNQNIEEGKINIDKYKKGIIVELVGLFEEGIDIECIMELKELYNKNFTNLLYELKKEYKYVLPMSIDNNAKFNYKLNTVTYTGCFLID